MVILKLALFVDRDFKGKQQLDTSKKKGGGDEGNSCKIGWVSVLSCFFVIISCAGAELTQKQVDGAYKGKPVSDILVIAVTGNKHNRRSFEKKFVVHLQSVGTVAVASEEAVPMPPDLKLKKETIFNAVNQYKNDAVIITQLIGKEKEDVHTHSRPGHRTFFSYSLDPGYSSTNTTVRLETNLYDAKTGKLIWSGRSKTLSRDSTDQIMNDVIKAVIVNLQKNKLIAPK